MAKKQLQDYLLQVKKEYKFIIKLAFEPEQEDILRLEKALMKYDLIDMTKPTKTVFQTAPIDFPNVEYGEIFIFDVTLAYPTTDKFLLEDVKHIFNVEYERICIRNADSPLAIEEEDQKEEVVEGEKEYDEKLSTDDNYDDDETQTEQSYGNDYNKDMLSTLTSKEAKEEMSVYKTFDLKDKSASAMNPETEKDSDIIESEPIVEAMDSIKKLLGVK